jgi:hypothetical protein
MGEATSNPNLVVFRKIFLTMTGVYFIVVI